jgi:hypothetical protein
MENIITIEQFLDNTDPSVVYKSKKSPLLSILLIIAGLILLIANKQFGSSPDSILPPLFTITGLGLTGWGATLIFLRKSKYILTQNKKDIRFYDILFDIKERERLLQIMKNGTIQELKELKQTELDTLKLRIASTSDGQFCYSQVLHYVPYEFVCQNEVCKHTPEEAQVIMEVRKNKR